MEKDYSLRNISDLTTHTLWVVQKKWYSSDYELTDDAFTYGSFYNKGWKQSTILKTANGELKVCSSFSGKHTVKTLEDEVLGETSQKLFDRRVTLTMTDGFQATHYNPSVWKSVYIWEDAEGQELLRIKFNAFSKKKAEITFIKPAAQIPHVNTLLLLTMKFYMMRMAVAAAM